MDDDAADFWDEVHWHDPDPEQVESLSTALARNVASGRVMITGTRGVGRFDSIAAEAAAQVASEPSGRVVLGHVQGSALVAAAMAAAEQEAEKAHHQNVAPPSDHNRTWWSEQWTEDAKRRLGNLIRLTEHEVAKLVERDRVPLDALKAVGEAIEQHAQTAMDRYVAAFDGATEREKDLQREAMRKHVAEQRRNQRRGGRKGRS